MIKGSYNDVLSVAISSDNKYLVSGSGDLFNPQGT